MNRNMIEATLKKEIIGIYDKPYRRAIGDSMETTKEFVYIYNSNGHGQKYRIPWHNILGIVEY